jgi:pimeloyl-ACP methyl ester carboxylesterase
VPSADGTRIAYWREGSGPSLLLVHGGACDPMAWCCVVPRLARRFRAYSYDRRGGRESGDTAPYAVERELEDLAAMLRAIGQPVHLLGHSTGGILALLGAQSGHHLLSLMLYQPAFVVEGAGKWPGTEMLAKMQSLLALGDRGEVVQMAIRETLELPEGEIAAMAAGPGWEPLLSAALTIPYDWTVWHQPLAEERVHAVRTPTLLLMGSESPQWLQVGTKAVFAALSDARLQVLAGQHHLATVTAPEQFAQARKGLGR